MRINFNSTMVRLKGTGTCVSGRFTLFQFHYGTIKRKSRNTLACFTSTFQFHYGTIKSNATIEYQGSSTNFNSTMVRLKGS